jgi:hypothetical protein
MSLLQLAAATALILPLFTSGAASASAKTRCAVTIPNGNTPPGEHPSPPHHGNGGALWTLLWPEGKVVFAPRSGSVQPDGSLGMKFPWWRGVRGKLTIEGHRLDAAASPLRAVIPEGYGDSGFQATGIIFPTEGCWEVTGKVGQSSLTFVTLVINKNK